MYIIVSTSKKYKGKIIGVDCIVRAGTIGHEIHITRPILLFLLDNNLINDTDIIVTKNSERFFLYSKIFKNIIEYDNLPDTIKETDILDITHINSLNEKRYDLEFKIDLEEKFPIIKKMRTNEIEIRTNSYNKLLSNIDYVNIEEINNEFIVIHHRHTDYGSVSLQNTMDIINFILSNFNLDIVVFTVLDSTDFSINSERIKFVNNISVYASYMNNEKCKAVITSFSGGGQLAQFCHNKNIYYYSDGGYVFYPGKNIDIIYKLSNDTCNMYSYFDLKKITNANIFISYHHSTLLKYIYDNQIDFLIDNIGFNKYLNI